MSFLIKICINRLFVRALCRRTDSLSVDHLKSICWRQDFEAWNYSVSCILLLSLTERHMFSSASYSRTYVLNSFPLRRETKFHTHTRHLVELLVTFLNLDL